MSTILGESKSGWICLEMNSGKKLYTKLPFDPFSEPSETWHTGIVLIEGDVYTLIKAGSPDGRLKMALISLREEPGENLEPPYCIRMDHVSLISKLSEESPLYEALVERETGIISSRPKLIVPA